MCVGLWHSLVRELGFRALDSVNQWSATVFHTWLQTATISMCVFVKEMRDKDEKKKRKRENHKGK